MSDTNIKTVQTIYGHFGRGDIPAIFDYMTDDVTFGIDGRVEDLDEGLVRRIGLRTRLHADLCQRQGLDGQFAAEQATGCPFERDSFDRHRQPRLALSAH